MKCRGLVDEPGNRAIEQRDVDMITFAGLVALDQAGQDGSERVHTGQLIGDRDTNFDRCTTVFVGLAGYAHQAAHPLQQEIIARPLGVGPGLPEPGD